MKRDNTVFQRFLTNEIYLIETSKLTTVFSDFWKKSMMEWTGSSLPRRLARRMRRRYSLKMEMGMLTKSLWGEDLEEASEKTVVESSGSMSPLAVKSWE